MANADLIDELLIVWFVMTALSVAYVAWNLFTHTPEMKVMKWGWVLVTLYTGIIGKEYDPSRMAFDERGDGGNDPGHDYFNDPRYASDGADEPQILGHYVSRLPRRRCLGVSGERVACR